MSEVLLHSLTLHPVPNHPQEIHSGSVQGRALFESLRQNPEPNPYLKQAQLRTPLNPEP